MKLQLKSKIILVLSFLLVCSVLGFGIFTILNATFPKKIQAENHEKPKIKIEDTKKEDVKEKDTSLKEVTVEEDSKNNSFDSAFKEDSVESDIDIYLSNSYKVGTDIKEGIYKVVTINGSTSGQYTISTNKKNNVDFYDGKLFFNFRYVELKDNETIYLIDADILSEENNKRYSDTRYVSGQYKVGFDIQPGSYKLIPAGQAGYVEISASPLGDVLFSRYVESSVELELKNGQYITISGINIVK